MARSINFPSLQVALDFVSWKDAEPVVGALSGLAGPKLLLEAGTPLIKGEGISVVSRIHNIAPRSPVIADLKTMDTAELEVSMAADAGADAAVVSGVAPRDTVTSFVEECRRRGIMSFVDSIGLGDPAALIEKARGADVVVIHRGIDEEASRSERGWSSIGRLRSSGFRVAVAGGIDLGAAAEALDYGADIVIVGRDITRNRDPRDRAFEYLRMLDTHKSAHV